MRSAGVVPEDAPDPMNAIVAQLRDMPVPILGLVPQRHLEDWGGVSLQKAGSSTSPLDEMTVAISYTLWRNPDDHADPANLAVLDDATRAALDHEPPWPRPQWILDAVTRMRYPTLWEAVRTRWFRDPSRHDLRVALVEHVNYIIVNHFGGAYPSQPGAEASRHPLLDERSIEPGFSLRVNGNDVMGIRIDTDPDVFGIGADLGANGLLTAVVPRDELPLIELAFATRDLG